MLFTGIVQSKEEGEKKRNCHDICTWYDLQLADTSAEGIASNVGLALLTTPKTILRSLQKVTSRKLLAKP